MLSLIIFIPLIGALAAALLPKGATKAVALGTSLVSFAVSLVVLAGFNSTQAGYQFVEAVPWIQQFGIGYKVGVDGISLWLMLLTTFIFPIAIWFSFGSIHERERNTTR